MALTRDQKAVQLAELKDKMQNAKSVMFAHYIGLTVPDISKLRGKLREGKAELKVAKKSLIQLAAKEINAPEILDTAVPGPVACIFSNEDPVAGASNNPELEAFMAALCFRPDPEPPAVARYVHHDGQHAAHAVRVGLQRTAHQLCPRPVRGRQEAAGRSGTRRRSSSRSRTGCRGSCRSRSRNPACCSGSVVLNLISFSPSFYVRRRNHPL